MASLAINEMTTAFHLDTLKTHHVRKRMNEQEKAEYRARRRLRACEVCAAKKTKCRHPSRRALDPAIPKTVFPLGGILQADVEREGGEAVSSLLLHYMTQTLFPRLFHKHRQTKTQDWVYLFCSSPLIYHATYYAVAVHQDVRCGGKFAWATRHDALVAKSKALHHVSAQIASFERDKAEVLLAGILILAVTSLDDEVVRRKYGFAFEPYMPWAHWHNVYGKIPIVEAHFRAVEQLVARVGGLENMKMKGVAALIAHFDLRNASHKSTRPAFPSIWDLEPSIMSSHHSLRTTSGRSPGVGFFVSLSSSAPANTIPVFMHVATINCFMEARVRDPPNDDDMEKLITTRNAVHHDLLCLPSIASLHTDEGRREDYTLYELARLAAIIYSTAVLFGLPADGGWHLPLLDQVRTHLDSLPEDYSCDLVVWVLSTCVLASLDVPQRSTFETRLRDVAARRGLEAWADVEAVNHDFLWSATACKTDVSNLWTVLRADGARP